MGDRMNESFMKHEEITEDNSDGALSNVKKFLRFSTEPKTAQAEREITSQIIVDKENDCSNDRGKTSGENFNRAKRLEPISKSEITWTPVNNHGDFIISQNERNELVFTKIEKKTLQMLEADICYTITEENDDDFDEDDNDYKFDHEKRGSMIQVVNDYQNRSGASEDLWKMNEIRRKLGFECFNSDKTINLSKQDMERVLKQVQETDHTNCDCLLFMISCHGAKSRHDRKIDDEEYGLLFEDEEIMYVEEITRMFDDYNCPTLKGKPKLFFIQSCRDLVDLSLFMNPFHGREWEKQHLSHLKYPWFSDSQFSILNTYLVFESVIPTDKENCNKYLNIVLGPLTDDGNTIHVCDCDNTNEEFMNNCHTEHCQNIGWDASDSKSIYGHLGNAVDDSDEDVSVLKCENDMLVMFAAPRDMMVWRNEQNGSWMIHHLHEVLMDYNLAKPKSLLRVLTKVSRQVSRLQTRTFNPSFDKKTIVPVIEHKLTKDILFQNK